MRGGLAAIIASAALCLAASARAAPVGVPLGPDRLMLDTPVGFSDTAGFGSPRLTEIAETLGGASNRVLVFALSDVDVRRFSAGDPIELHRYLLAVTPRAKERERIGASQFAELMQDMTRNLGAPPAPADFRNYLVGRAPGVAHLLVDLRRDPQILSVLHGTMVSPPQTGWNEKPAVFKLSSTTLALIGSRALYISAFSAYDSPADVLWIQSITDRWVEELQRLNK